MEATTEIEVQVSKTRIISVKRRIGRNVLKLVEASKLSLDDEFMQYDPKEGTYQARFKEILTDAIQSGLSDFWRPKMDPSFDETGDNIFYVVGKEPAVGKSKNWWKEVAEKVGLELGTKQQYVAFLGCLIKKLVERGWDVAEAWYDVCTNSKRLGHFWNSVDAKHDLEMTGSRKVCEFYDLGNTFKILADDEIVNAFWIAGGDCYRYSFACPLESIILDNHNRLRTRLGGICSVGWLVLNCD